MTDTGLNRRLRQHARRSGPAVALTMVLATGLMIAIFIMVFAWLNPYLSDFIPSTDESDQSAQLTSETEGQPRERQPTEAVQPSAVVTETIAGGAVTPPPASDSPAEPTQAPAEFVADFQSNPQNPVNLRSEPGTNGTQIVEILEPGTPLQSLGREEEVNGIVWMQFQTAEGQVGWIREIDAQPREA